MFATGSPGAVTINPRHTLFTAHEAKIGALRVGKALHIWCDYHEAGEIRDEWFQVADRAAVRRENHLGYDVIKDREDATPYYVPAPWRERRVVHWAKFKRNLPRSSLRTAIMIAVLWPVLDTIYSQGPWHGLIFSLGLIGLLWSPTRIWKDKD